MEHRAAANHAQSPRHKPKRAWYAAAQPFAAMKEKKPFFD